MLKRSFAASGPARIKAPIALPSNSKRRGPKYSPDCEEGMSKCLDLFPPFSESHIGSENFQPLVSFILERAHETALSKTVRINKIFG